MNVIIFGTGMVYRQHKNFFSDVKILCFLDNDETKWGKRLDGSIIVSPVEVYHYDYDYIFLMSVHFKEMREQLKCLEIPEDKIIDQEHLSPFESINLIRRYEISCGDDGIQKKGRILLISHAFGSSGGAPVVLVVLARMLRKNGYYVEIYARDCGEVKPLLSQTLKAGISISLYWGIELLDIEMVCRNYDLIVVNTVTLHAIVQKLSGKTIPVIWWLHEEDDVYRDEHFEMWKIPKGDNIHVYAVGERARVAYIKYSGGLSADILPYGVEETYGDEVSEESSEKLVFALIGYGCERKGQDIVYEAAVRQFCNWSHRIEIWFIGEISEEKRKIYETLPFLKCKGFLKPDTFRGIYRQIDVLVCPSLNDPMPGVVSEAMMHKKTCIVSDMTGQYEYIVPYVNGLTCSAGNVESLEVAMQWAIDNREKLETIGEAGYEIYREHFSMESFRNKALAIMEKYLPENIGW